LSLGALLLARQEKQAAVPLLPPALLSRHAIWRSDAQIRHDYQPHLSKLAGLF